MNVFKLAQRSRVFPMYYILKKDKKTGLFKVNLSNDTEIRGGDQLIYIVMVNGEPQERTLEVLEIVEKRKARGVWIDIEIPDFYSLKCKAI